MSNNNGENSDRRMEEAPNPMLEQEVNGQQQQPLPQHLDVEISPQAVDDLLTREIMNLSLQARNDIQEEIHGVKCLSPQESPALLLDSISRLNRQLAALSPSAHADSYRMAARYADSFVHTAEFKLRFLRKHFFEVRLAAQNLCEYLHAIHSLFGNDALRRELCMHENFSKEETRLFRKGYYQLLPIRDRSGRRILAVFPDEEVDNMSVEVRAKFIAYLSTIATKDDYETQRLGMVLLVWFDATFTNINNLFPPNNNNNNSRSNIDMYRTRLQKYGQWGCVRPSAIHVCSPDTPAFRLRRSLMVLRAQSAQRSRIKMHLGTPVELRYILQGFGIPTDNIPMTWTGKIKVAYLKSWLKLRRSLEENNALRASGISDGVLDMSSVVECPHSNDVLFRQGVSLSCHVGNTRYRSLVEGKVLKMRQEHKEELENEYNSEHNYELDDAVTAETSGRHSRTRKIVKEVTDEILQRRKGRILAWQNFNQKFHCWLEVRDPVQIYNKIEYTVKDIMRQTHSQTMMIVPNTITTLRPSSNEEEVDAYRVDASTPAASKITATTTQSSHTRTIQNTDSSTSIFLDAASSHNKRARLASSTSDPQLHQEQEHSNATRPSRSLGNASTSSEDDNGFCSGGLF